MPRFPGAQELEERAGDELQPVGLAAPRVAARMQHDAEQPERLGAIELVAHRLDRLPAQRRVRRRQVDQIAGVRHDRGRCRPR